MIVALETSKAMSLNLCLNSKGWGKGSDPKRFAVAEDGVSAANTLINNVQELVEFNFKFSPCILTISHFYYPTNALNYIKLRD